MIPMKWETWWVIGVMFVIFFTFVARKIIDVRQKHLQDLRQARYFNSISVVRDNTNNNNDSNDNIPEVENPSDDNGDEEELPVEISGESVAVSAERAKEGCSICLDAFGGDEGDDVAVLSCDHMFHLHCIVAWTIDKKLCPLCRQRVDRVVVAKMDLGFVDLEAQI